MRFDELDILDIGNEIQLAGSVWVGKGKAIVCLFPEEDRPDQIEFMQMDKDQWATFLRQSDLMETKVLAKQADGTLAKAILRKSQRQIDQEVSWRVFKAAGYRCEYCFTEGPLTVDHIICWESLGATVEANLKAACRKCNKTRGNLPYDQWMQHPYYVRVSQGLPPENQRANEEVVGRLEGLPRNPVQRRR